MKGRRTREVSVTPVTKLVYISVESPTFLCGGGLLLCLLFQHSLVIVWHDLNEMLHSLVPVLEELLSEITVGVLYVLPDVIKHGLLLLFRFDALESDKAHVALVGEFAVGIVHVCDTSAHTGGEVAASGTKDNDAAAGHVLTTVVAKALDDSRGPGVADAETFATLATEEGLTSSSTIQSDVANDDVVLGDETIIDNILLGVDSDFTTGQTLPAIIIGITLHGHGDTLGESESHGLTAVTLELELNGIIGQSFLTESRRDLVRKHSTGGTVQIVDLAFVYDRSLALERILGLGNEIIVKSLIQTMVLASKVSETGVGVELCGGREKGGEVQPSALVVEPPLVDLQVLGLADHFFHSAVTKLRHDLTDLLGEEEEVVHNMLGLAGELLSKLLVLGGNAHGTGIQMTLSHHDATHGNERGGSEAELLGAEKTSDRHVTSGLDLAIGLKLDPVAKSVENQSLLGLGKAELPWKTASFDAGPSSGTGTAIVTTDDDVVRQRLGDASGNDTNTNLGNELGRNLAVGLGILQIMNELRKILDGVNVVMRRRGDQTDTGGGVAVVGDVLGNLEAGELTALARLGTLCHLDLDLVAVGKVVGRNSETTRGNLLDTGSAVIKETFRILSSLAGVRSTAQTIHRDGKRLVGLSTDGTKGHGTGRKALDNISHRFNLIKRDGAARVELELELTAEGHLLVLFIDDSGKLLVSIAGVGTSSDLHIHHRTWGVQVSLATLAVVELTIAGNKRNGILALLGVGAVVESVKVTV